MFEINPHALYSRQDLIEGLKPMGIDADGWLARLQPLRRFRRAYWGWDLIRAVEDAAELSVAGQAKIPKKANQRKPGRKRPNRVEIAGSNLIREFLLLQKAKP